MQGQVHDIDRALDDELNAARELLGILKEEQRHLIAVETDALIGVTDRKTALVTRMSEVSSRRAQAFAAHHIAGTAAAVQAWLARVDANTRDKWSALMTIAAEAQELNHTNGLLIARHITNSQNALQILQGNASVGRIYGPDGQSTAGSAGRTFAVG